MAVIHSDAPPVHRPSRRNMGFGIGSLLLLFLTLWVVWFDYNREWKQYQREFNELEIAKTEHKLKDEAAKLDANKEFAADQERLAQTRADQEGRKQELQEALRAVDEAEARFHVADENWKVRKSNFDAEKYEFEEAREHVEASGMDRADKDQAIHDAEVTFKAYEDAYSESILALEAVTITRDAAIARTKDLTAEADKIVKRIRQFEAPGTALKDRIKALQPSFAKKILNAPVIDMAAPTLKIDQVILPNLRSDINFLMIEKVDRCVTCHKGIMTAEYEEDAQPFRAHPHLDLFLSSDSPHPYTKFGCTVCHQGLDRATSFESAMHTPSTEEQAEKWEKEFGWHRPHYWDSPQLSAQHLQAACRTCHLKEVRVRGADDYNKGLDILEHAGCYGCHKLDGYERQRKTGPDLRHISSKVTADWAFRWIESPRAYRPTTWMPEFFKLSNSSSPQDQERTIVEIDSIATYLFETSMPFAGTGDPVPHGDVQHGREMVEQKGCLGCHRIGENPTVRGTARRDFGPALDRIGDKLSPEWVYDWLRDPKRYFPETSMPDLRLTNQEAGDITAYLMTLRGASPEPRPRTNTAVLDATTLDYLTSNLTHEQAAQKLAGMNEQVKKAFLGEKLVARYGCFGCHRINGFLETLPIGVDLSKEGTKLITRLDFGFADIEHTKPAWFFQKLKDPRVFDVGKVKLPRERLRMPDFGFSDEEARSLVTLLLSFQKDVQPLPAHRILDERAAAVEAGRRIVQNNNCRGCHLVEGEGAAIQEVIKDQAFWPPNLFRQGQKVQSDWLYGFLRSPTPIRPWLTVRMPTFHFSDEDASTLTKYFAAADSVPYPFQKTPEGPASDELLRAGKETFDQFRCMSCHPVGPPPAGVALGDLAPDLTMAWSRLRNHWITDWLRDPQALMPGTRMPGFFYSDGEPMYPDADDRMKAVVEYVRMLGAPPVEKQRASTK